MVSFGVVVDWKGMGAVLFGRADVLGIRQCIRNRGREALLTGLYGKGCGLERWKCKTYVLEC